MKPFACLAITLLPFAGLAADSNVADAAMKADKAAVRSLVQQKADVNAKASDGSTALHWAIESDDLEIVDLLLQAGADVKGKDRFGFTPLYFAISNNNVEMVRRLLKSGAAVNAKDKTGQTALVWAIRSNQPALAKILISRDAELNSKTVAGKAPERRPPGAGGGSHGTGIVRGGWPDRGYQGEASGGLSPLLFAARDGRLEAAKLLVEAHADVNQPDANNIPPLMMAITNNHFDVAKFLLENGADPKAVDPWGRTPLWTAVDVRNLELGRSGEQRAGDQKVNRAAALDVIKMLVDRGVDVNVRTKEIPPVKRFVMSLGDLSWVYFTGQTPFLRAALSGDVTTMRLLLEHGADPNIPTNSNTTALMAAAGVNWVVGQTYTESKESLMEAVKLCIEKGGDVNAKNAMGITAVIGTANRGSDEILEFLVKQGAKLDVKDNEGRTPTDWAKGVFLATNAPEEKPSTIALIKKLSGQSGQ
jgi:ankyrin repeat protein